MPSMRHSLLLLIFILLTSCHSKPQDKFEDPVVNVNDQVLSGSDFSKILVRKFIEQDIKYPKTEIISVLKKQIVEDFILQSIFNDYAQEENILVKKEILDQEFDSFISKYPDKDSFDIFLNESGQNKTAFRLMIKDQILRDLVKEDLLLKQDFVVDQKAVTEYYTKNKEEFKTESQIKIKQIVFESEEDGIKILELLKKDNNKNFETFAEKYSLGPEKVKGGDLGWVNISSYPPFEEAAKSSAGQVTGIIKSENGFHIFKVLEKKGPSVKTLAEVENKIKTKLLNEQKNVFLNSWVQEKVKESKIKINNDLITKITVSRPTSF